MDIKAYIKSPAFKGVLAGILITIVALLIFQAGVTMGYRKATFDHRLGDNYFRAFDGRPGKFVVFRGDRAIAEHGAAGKVVSIDLPTFVVAGPDGIEKVVLVQDDTVIRRFEEQIKPEDLKVDDFTVVLGEPNENSQVEAKLIRILPTPPPFPGGFGTTTR